MYSVKWGLLSEGYSGRAPSRYCEDVYIYIPNDIRVEGTIVRCSINNSILSSSYSLIQWLGKYATEWALVRSTVKYWSSEREYDFAKYRGRMAQMVFMSYSVIMFQNFVGAVAYVREKCSLKVKF
jgi:hypothetical protein